MYLICCLCTGALQEAWEAQAAIVGRNASATAEGPADEQAAGPEDDASQAQHAYQAQLERLLAADVVLVPYGVLSQEVGSQAGSAIMKALSRGCYAVPQQHHISSSGFPIDQRESFRVILCLLPHGLLSICVLRGDSVVV